MKASEIITSVRRILRDPDPGDRWVDADLLAYMRDGENAIIRVMPSANAVHLTVQLTAGETRHDVLPFDTIHLLDVDRNMGSSGEIPGPPILEIEKERLDSFNRSWSDKVGTVIDNYAVDPRDDRRFHTSPRVSQSTDVWVEILISQMAPLLPDVTRDITIPDFYRHTLQMFTQGYALMEDTPESDFPRGEAFINQAYQSLGIDLQQAEDEEDG